MRNLFRRASFLFWQYPILWLPIVVVDPIVFCLNTFANKLNHAIILSVVTSHSVLGNTPEPIAPSSFQTLKILLLTKPIDWGSHLIALCLYISAMMATFTLISALRSKQRFSLGSILYPLQQSFSRLVFFSLKLLIAIGIAALILSSVVVVFFQKNGTRFISTQNFGYFFATLALSAIAYLMAPAAVKFLRPHDSEAITPEIARQTKISAVLASIASAAIYFFAIQIRPSFSSRSTIWGGVLYEAIGSLVSATPYIVLFIALSLLAKNDEPDIELFGVEPELS